MIRLPPFLPGKGFLRNPYAFGSSSLHNRLSLQIFLEAVG